MSASMDVERVRAAKKLAHEWHITIDEEFASVNRRLSPQEQSLLETDLETGGCRDALAVWSIDGKLILLDGHYRYRMCSSLGVPFGVVAIAVESREAAIAWIKTNQRARRNCTPEEIRELAGKISYQRGKQYDDAKSEHGGNRRGESSAHDAHLNGSTAESVAAEHGVDPATIRRDAAFARAVDTVVANTGGTHADLASILAGDLGTKKDIERLADLPPDEQRQAVAGGKQAVKQAAARVRRKPTAKPDRPPKLDLPALKQAFLGLSDDDRMAFLDWVDHEVFAT